MLELDAVEVVRGHHISQARVIAHVGDTEVLTVLGALGERPLPDEGQWAHPARRAAARRCARRGRTSTSATTPSASRLEERLAAGRPF